MGTKREYRSRIAIDGLDRAPHRAFLRACGLDDEDLDKPRVGIVTTHGENTPCSMSLAPQADAARLGVAAGGGMPVPFTTISVSDGISMNHEGMRLSLAVARDHRRLDRGGGARPCLRRAGRLRRLRQDAARHR